MRLHERLHWVTVAVVVAVLVISFIGDVDPHGPGNDVFRLHSTLGFALYVLAGLRFLLWWRDRSRPPLRKAFRLSPMSTSSRAAFYLLLLALPISGWVLASEEGVAGLRMGLPLLPQWLYSVAPPPSGASWHQAGTPDTALVTALIRLHTGLAIALSITVAIVILSGLRRSPRVRID